MPGAVFLRGADVTLQTVEQEDIEFVQDYVNDPDVRAGLSMSMPINGKQEQEYFEERISGDDDVHLLICADDEAVGMISLTLDDRHGSAEIGISIAPEFHGNGYGTEASRLLTTYAFDELRMHRVMARAYAFNEGSKCIWEKLGFEQEGLHREAAFTNGEYVDVVFYGALADEWEQ
ncbi:GNAT family N-acetyltransferase [Halorussus halophilus]|uniref:GNAT family N-acetyltransferase n=1 Tax=Halorussus halophilus TaxID=2650975 RepID=UPI001300F28E|nr:GNAT family protein [Halorussus halophilus]